MTYEYRKSAAEKKAEELLRSKGWHVTAPLCPDCHGAGAITTWQTWGETGSRTQSISTGTQPCPQGCLTPTYFFNTSTSNNVFTNNTIADGTQGMRRGE